MNRPLSVLLGLLLLAGCDSTGGRGAAIYTSTGIVVNGDTFEDRAKAAWAAAPSVSLSEGAADVVTKVGSKLAVDAPGELSRAPSGVEIVDLSSEALRTAAMGTDENVFADALRAAGAKVLVVHSGLKESFDRDSHVLSRLYHHGQLERFQLSRVEHGAYVYLINDKPLRFDPAVADAAIRWMREKISGKNPPPFQPVASDRGNWLLITSLRGAGQELAFSLAEAPTLDVALLETVDDLEAMHRRQREILGFPRLSVHVDDLIFEIHRIKERAVVVPRADEDLAAMWEMGIDGAILIDRTEGKKAAGAWPGSVAVARGMTGPDEFLRGVAREFKFDSLRPWRDEAVSLELIRTSDYRELRGAPVVPMYRGTTQVPVDAVTLASVKASIIYAGEWWLANLQPDGSVTYKFWPEENRYSNEYNHVRHELATWNLWQAWTLDPRPEFMEGAIRAQDWTMRSLVQKDGTNLEDWERKLLQDSPLKAEIEREGMAYFTYGDNTKLGSAVVALFGMIEVARATGDHSNDDVMRKLGRYVLASQLKEGNFRPYWVPAGHPYEFAKNDIVPGEAALALVYLSEYFNDPQYLDALEPFFAYYRPWFRSREEKKNLRAPWPAYTYDNTTRLDLVQFGPWTVMAANAYTRVRPEKTDVAKFGFEVARWMVDTYEYSQKRTLFPDYVGGYYKFLGELPAMQAFCYGEGTAAAYQMALRQDPAQAPYFELATRETVRIGIQMQHDRLDSLYYSRPELVEGGIRYALNEPKVRVDYTYHGQSTLYQWYTAAKDDPNLPATVKAEPNEAIARLYAAMDLPGFRAPDARVRTSVPAIAGIPVGSPMGAAGQGGLLTPAQPTKSEDDGGE